MRGGPEKEMFFQSFPHTEEEEEEEDALKEEEEEKSVSGDPFVVVKLEDEREGQEAERSERSSGCSGAALDISLFAPLDSSEDGEEERGPPLTPPAPACWPCAPGQDEDAGPPPRRPRGRRKRLKRARSRRRCRPAAVSRDKSKASCPGEQAVERSLASTPYTVPDGETSPSATTVPPVLHPPSGMDHAGVGGTQQNILLEVLSYCRFLHAAVQRLEQKIDKLESKFRNPELSEETVAAGGGQLSWALAQRLGPSPPTQLLRSPAWGPDAAHVLPHSGGGKRRRRRRRRAQKASEEAARGAKEEDPRDNEVQRNSGATRRRKRRRRAAAAGPGPGPGPEEARSVQQEKNRNMQTMVKKAWSRV